jgi:predicted heme/steroid binding protein
MATGRAPSPISLERLARFDGGAAPAYVAAHGRVYDVSSSPEWRDGLHRGLHWAGQDLSEALAESPHGATVLAGLPVVGRLADASSAQGVDP